MASSDWRTKPLSVTCGFAATLRSARPRALVVPLKSNAGPDRSWVCLDDMAKIFSPNCQHLVLCDPAVGLTQRELRSVESRLGLPASVASRAA